MKTFSIDRQDEIHQMMDMLWTVQNLLIVHPDLSMTSRADLSCMLDHFKGDAEACKDDIEMADMHRNCLYVLIDLTCPDKNLSAVSRDSLAELLGYLLTRLDKALNRGFILNNSNS